TKSLCRCSPFPRWSVARCCFMQCRHEQRTVASIERDSTAGGREGEEYYFGKNVIHSSRQQDRVEVQGGLPRQPVPLANPHRLDRNRPSRGRLQIECGKRSQRPPSTRAAPIDSVGGVLGG